MYSRFRQGVGISVSVLLSHTALVYQYRGKKVIKNDYSTQNTFKPGDADDMIMDNLRTGDILLFKRNPFLYYFPAALSIFLHQAIHGNQVFDHCGVIIRNQEGVPLVLEATFGSVKLRPYEDRILQSKAEQIVMIAVKDRLDESNEDREENMAFVLSLVDSYKAEKSFIGSVYKGLLAAACEIVFHIRIFDVPYSPAAYITSQFLIHRNKTELKQATAMNAVDYFFLRIIKRKLELQQSSSDSCIDNDEYEPALNVIPNSFLKLAADHGFNIIFGDKQESRTLRSLHCSKYSPQIVQIRMT